MPRILKYAGRGDKALRANQKHAFASLYALSLYEQNAIYTFIPKNGCSTMRLSLAIANGVLTGPDQINWIHHNNTTFAASLRELISARYTFAIIRCPYARLVSCYLDKIVGRNLPFWALDHALGRKLAPNEFTFRRFVTTIAKPALRDLDEHWRPQSDFLVYETYDDLFDLADFATIKTVLGEKIGFAIHDARRRTKHGSDGLRRVDECDADTRPLKFLTLRERGRTPNPASLFDEELIAMVRTMYAADVALMEERFPQSLMFGPAKAD